MDRIVLAFSGGLDTAVAIPWLDQRYGAAIIAVTMDLGQEVELEAVRDRALAAGARRAHVLDLREEFARDYVLPALKADAIKDNGLPLAAPLGRALIAQKLVELAEIERADAVAHGCSGSGEQQRFEAAIRTLNPRLRVIAAARQTGSTQAQRATDAPQRGIAVQAAADHRYSVHNNLWGRSLDCPELESPWDQRAEEIGVLAAAPSDYPDEAANVEITFARGVPVAINGITMPLLELIGSLTTIAGAHGVGRIERAARRPAANRSRTIGAAPAAIVLHAAHRQLRSLVTSRDLERFCRTVSVQYADLIDRGLWFTPMRQALDAFVESVQERVSGAIRVKLFKGECSVVEQSSYTLPSLDTASSEPIAEPLAAEGVAR